MVQPVVALRNQYDLIQPHAARYTSGNIDAGGTR